MPRSYRDSDMKLLWGLAAARCAFPDCRVECVHTATSTDPAVVLGKVAHIVAASDDGPRGDPSFSPDLRDRYDNLILVCGAHHDIIDGQPLTYSVQRLREMKAQHEAWVRTNLAREMPRVGFSELEVVAAGIVAAPSADPPSLVLVPPRDKLERNGLTEPTAFLVTMGLAKAKEVGRFVSHLAKLDSDFPERLKAGFVAEYVALRARGLEADAVFQALVEIAEQGRRDFVYRAACLAVVAYLFERCEVFET